MFLQGFHLIPTGGSPGVQAGQTILLSTMINIGRVRFQIEAERPIRFHPTHDAARMVEPNGIEPMTS